MKKVFTSWSIFNLLEFVRVQIFNPSIRDFLEIIVHIISLEEQNIPSLNLRTINIRFELEPTIQKSLPIFACRLSGARGANGIPLT